MSDPLTDRPAPQIFVDADACPVREEVYRVAARLNLLVHVVANGSRPMRPPGLPNVRMVLVGDSMDAADDWIAAEIAAADICVTNDIPLAARYFGEARSGGLFHRKALDAGQYRQRPGRPRAEPPSARAWPGFR
jgi:hypothetical protein